MSRARVGVFLFLAVSAATSGRARADTAPSPGVYSVSQVGQNVNVGVHGRACDVFREDTETGEQVTLCDGREFTSDEFRYDTDVCASCDTWIGGGTRCVSTEANSIVDFCVPPGSYRYWPDESIPCSFGGVDTTIEVTDSGDPCLGGGVSCSAAESDAASPWAGLGLLAVGLLLLAGERRRRAGPR